MLDKSFAASVTITKIYYNNVLNINSNYTNITKVIVGHTTTNKDVTEMKLVPPSESTEDLQSKIPDD